MLGQNPLDGSGFNDNSIPLYRQPLGSIVSSHGAGGSGGVPVLNSGGGQGGMFIGDDEDELPQYDRDRKLDDINIGE